MNLQKLFKIQEKLDNEIMNNHPELKGQNNLDWKILALLVELGECANEWRGFKKWSNDQEPRTKIPIKTYYALRKGKTRNPLLEEYVDCLHFILSIGLELYYDTLGTGFDYNEPIKWRTSTVTRQFNEIFRHVSDLCEDDKKNDIFEELLAGFMGLGEMLGFTIDQIEQAYLDKNKINHKRQNTGY
jgi:dimeric dUTPase (all-alpha-NTP-PPase superfamily)